MVGFRRASRIPFDMFDLERNADEARRAQKVENLYHRGQDLAWDGRRVLRELIEKHGGIHVSDEYRDAIGTVFDVILWGELAAWKISAQLAEELVELEPKMAATSQAHDEARHFYVMYDYLVEMGHRPRPLDRSSRKLLEHVIKTRSLAQKLLGMQLQVEAMALTLFQSVRETRVEPVLADLLRYYEKDEARHVGLGIQYLPQMISRMKLPEGLALLAFQVRVIGWSLRSLKSMEPALRTLGLDPRQIMALGRAKQLIAFTQLWEHLGIEGVPRSREIILRSVNAVARVMFPADDDARDPVSLLRQMKDSWDADLLEGVSQTSLEPDEAPDLRVVS